MMLLFAEGASFDVTRLTDYGAVGLMLALVVFAYNQSQKKLQQVYELRIADMMAELTLERSLRQGFETRITNILDAITKAVGGLTTQVGQKREAIDQLAAVITELVSIVNSIKKGP